MGHSSRKQAEAFYNPGKNTHSTHLHDLVLALESADVLLVEDRDELRQPPRDLCCAGKRSFISLNSNAFSKNMEKATCEKFYNYITQLTQLRFEQILHGREILRSYNRNLNVTQVRNYSSPNNIYVTEQF